MSAGASGFPSGESMNRGQIGPGADARRPRVGPSTVRATSHRHRIGKRMPCATVRAMQPDSTRAGDTDRRPPSGPMMDTPPPRNRVAADEGPNRGTGAGPEGGSAHRPGKVALPDAPPRGCREKFSGGCREGVSPVCPPRLPAASLPPQSPESRPPRRPCRDMAGAGSGPETGAQGQGWENVSPVCPPARFSGNC